MRVGTHVNTPHHLVSLRVNHTHRGGTITAHIHLPSIGGDGQTVRTLWHRDRTLDTIGTGIEHGDGVVLEEPDIDFRGCCGLDWLRQRRVHDQQHEYEE